MSLITPEITHPKSIWTWNNTKRGRKATLYLPYLQSISNKRGVWEFIYNGGDFKCHLKDIEVILLYGATASLPCAFLDDLRKYGIPLLIHRRNMAMPSMFLPGIGCDSNDILTKQIIARENEKKRAYITRSLLREQFKSMESKIKIPNKSYVNLASARNVTKVRIIEAKVAKRYWQKYYATLGLEVSRRDNKHPVNQALNACSVFMSSILLRWCLHHRFSVSHGYLHETTSYPALVYDLIEPYREYINTAVEMAAQESDDGENLVESSVSHLKVILDEKVYCHVTRQTCTRSVLLHGAVLALRAYLAGEMDRFILPVEGEKAGGRPIKVSYRLPGGVSV